MIKKYQEFIKESKEDINSICEKYGLINYTINEDGSIDSDSDIFIKMEKLTKLPLIFNKVCGTFDCSYNYLTNLEGFPKEVGEDFDCSENQLTSLKGCPKEVGGYFYCSNNQLTSFEGFPEIIRSVFDCSYNKITSFKGCPQIVYGDFNCRHNNIRDFYGFPDFWEGDLYLFNNPIYEVYKLFNRNNKCTELLNTTRTIVNGDSIRVDGILDVADAIGIKLPEDWKEQIINYKLIQWYLI